MNWFTTEDPALKRLHFWKVAISVIAILTWIALYAMFILAAFNPKNNAEGGPLAPAAMSTGFSVKLIPFISIFSLLPIKKRAFLLGAIVVNAAIALWLLSQILVLDLG